MLIRELHCQKYSVVIPPSLSHMGVKLIPLLQWGGEFIKQSLPVPCCPAHNPVQGTLRLAWHVVVMLCWYGHKARCATGVHIYTHTHANKYSNALQRKLLLTCSFIRAVLSAAYWNAAFVVFTPLCCEKHWHFSHFTSKCWQEGHLRTSEQAPWHPYYGVCCKKLHQSCSSCCGRWQRVSNSLLQ